MKTVKRLGFISLIIFAFTLTLAFNAHSSVITNLTFSNQTSGDWGDRIVPEPVNIVPACTNFLDNSDFSIPNSLNQYRADIIASYTSSSFDTKFRAGVFTQRQVWITSALYVYTVHQVTTLDSRVDLKTQVIRFFYFKEKFPYHLI